MNSSSASFIRRSVALFIDYLILEVILTVLMWPFGKKSSLEFGEMLEILETGDLSNIQHIFIAIVVYFLVLTVLWGFYFIWFIGSTGQTPGKKLMRIKVIRADGNPMDYKTAFNRFTGYTVSLSVFGLGFLWALFDRNRQAWHDKMAKTRVVNTTVS